MQVLLATSVIAVSDAGRRAEQCPLSAPIFEAKLEEKKPVHFAITCPGDSDTVQF